MENFERNFLSRFAKRKQCSGCVPTIFPKVFAQLFSGTSNHQNRVADFSFLKNKSYPRSVGGIPWVYIELNIYFLTAIFDQGTTVCLVIDELVQRLIHASLIGSYQIM